nr:S-adenosyl-L-methionine-dependent methyltransferases superfamily protein [Tanacetum cinerariifolium]
MAVNRGQKGSTVADHCGPPLDRHRTTNLKSMVTVGLASLSCNYDLLNYVYAKNTLKFLCIRYGGGSLPLFLASKIPGVMADIVETDPVVISTSTQAMGFLSYSIMKKLRDLLHPKPTFFDEILWKGVQERLHLYESDAEKFITNKIDIYDMVFVDAYDGDDVFPHKLWDPNSVFLKALGERLHPDHGTVVVNLHSNIGSSVLLMTRLAAANISALNNSQTNKHMSDTVKEHARVSNEVPDPHEPSVPIPSVEK